jgi:hypothetical protein
MYKQYDNNTFFRAVSWAKRNIRKGKSRLNTYAAAEKYYGVDAKSIERYLLKREKDFMAIDYEKYPDHTITEYKLQKRAEEFTNNVLNSGESLFELTHTTAKDYDYPEDFTDEDINMINTAKLNKMIKENERKEEEKRQARLERRKQPCIHDDPYADC